MKQFLFTLIAILLAGISHSIAQATVLNDLASDSVIIPNLRKVVLPETTPAILSVTGEEEVSEGALVSYNAESETIYPVDTSNPVGEIPIQSGVSQTGGRTYTIPLDLPPGINGLAPSLSLNYNSQQGNGLLGIGWGLSGLSAITRSNKNIYFDGKTDGIALDNSDAFMLDGVRLIKTGEGGTIAHYQSEQGYILVEGMSASGTISSFIVRYPDGKVATYTGQAPYLVYPLTSLKDVDENEIKYSYYYTDNTPRIKDIQYNNQNSKLEFSYLTRPDSIVSFNNGYKIRQDYLLSGITCKWRGNILHSYSLEYDRRAKGTLLKRVGFSANGKSLNPLRFEYGTGSGTDIFKTDSIGLRVSYEVNEGINTEEYRVFLRTIRGKFDYSSSTDGLIMLPAKVPYLEHIEPLVPPVFSYCFNNGYATLGNEEKSIIIYTRLEEDASVGYAELTIDNDFVDIFCADLRGDQHESIIKVNNSIENETDKLTFQVYAYITSTGLCLQYTRSYELPTIIVDAFENKSCRPKYFFTGDFNGDGKMEVMVVTCPTMVDQTVRNSHCYIFDLENDTILYQGTPFVYDITFPHYYGGNESETVNESDRIFVMDYNADGKSDICLIKSTGTYIFSFNTLRTENRSTRNQKDYLGHSQLEKDGNIIIDWGAKKGEIAYINNYTSSTNSFKNGIVTKYPKTNFWNPVKIKGVNIDRIKNYGLYLDNCDELYQMVSNGCVTKASRALNIGGAFNIGIFPKINHPYWLHFQMKLYSNGLRPWIYTSHVPNIQQ